MRELKRSGRQDHRGRHEDHGRRPRGGGVRGQGRSRRGGRPRRGVRRTIRECVEAGRNYGASIIVDMVQVPDIIERARAVEAMGAAYIGIHVAIDEQMEGKTPFDILRHVARAVSIPVAVAGGINSETAAEAVKAGASIVIVGGAVTKATDAAEATRADQRRHRDGWNRSNRSSSCGPPAPTSASVLDACRQPPTCQRCPAPHGGTPRPPRPHTGSQDGGTGC